MLTCCQYSPRTISQEMLGLETSFDSETIFQHLIGESLGSRANGLSLFIDSHLSQSLSWPSSIFNLKSFVTSGHSRITRQITHSVTMLLVFQFWYLVAPASTSLWIEYKNYNYYYKFCVIHSSSKLRLTWKPANQQSVGCLLELN